MLSLFTPIAFDALISPTEHHVGTQLGFEHSVYYIKLH